MSLYKADSPFNLKEEAAEEDEEEAGEVQEACAAQGGEFNIDRYSHTQHRLLLAYPPWSQRK
jgi:hypothetical protein